MRLHNVRTFKIVRKFAFVNVSVLLKSVGLRVIVRMDVTLTLRVLLVVFLFSHTNYSTLFKLG